MDQPCFICGRTDANGPGCLSGFAADVLEVVAMAMRFASAQSAQAVTKAHVLYALASATVAAPQRERRGIDGDKIRRDLSERFARDVVAGADANAEQPNGAATSFDGELVRWLSELSRRSAGRSISIDDLLDGFAETQRDDRIWIATGERRSSPAASNGTEPSKRNGHHADPWRLSAINGAVREQRESAFERDPVWGILPRETNGASDPGHRRMSAAASGGIRDAQTPYQPAHDEHDRLNGNADLLEQVRRDAAGSADENRKPGIASYVAAYGQRLSSTWSSSHRERSATDRVDRREGFRGDFDGSSRVDAGMHEHLDRIIYLLSEQGTRLDALEREIREARVRWRESGTEEWRGGGVHRIRRKGAEARDGADRLNADTAIVLDGASPSDAEASRSDTSYSQSASGSENERQSRSGTSAYRSMTSGLLRGESAANWSGWGRRTATERVARTHGAPSSSSTSPWPRGGFGQRAADSEGDRSRTSETRSEPRSQPENRGSWPSAGGAPDDGTGSGGRSAVDAGARGEPVVPFLGTGPADPGARWALQGERSTTSARGHGSGTGAGMGTGTGSGSGSGAGTGTGGGTGTGSGTPRGAGSGHGRGMGNGHGEAYRYSRGSSGGSVGALDMSSAAGAIERNVVGRGDELHRQDEVPGEREKRFYLTLDDDVVDAPSIGPRTAERLYPVGIGTVRDLLAADPHAAANRIAARHVTSEVITDWQDQARLVCTVPWLRGTHAQLLVGAGYRQAAEVAEAGGPVVAAAVARFAQTRQGERLLRGGPAPESEKVGSWVEHARIAEPWRAPVER